MFIKKELLKELNGNYFRMYQDRSALIEYFPLKCTTTTDQIEKVYDFVLDDEGFDPEFVDQVRDLLTILSGESYPFMSATARCMEEMRQSYAVLMKSAMEQMSDTTKQVIRILSSSDESYVVGGSVRDTLIGKKNKDVDFVTDIPYDELESRARYAGFKVQEEGKQFLVMIVSKNGEQFEIANFRKDGTYKDGRRPESVEIGTVFDDAQRRDFTVNALYYRLKDQTLFDPTGMGIADIGSGTLRFVGKASQRLEEDTLRAYRFYRFLGKGFNPDPASLRAVRTAIIEEQKKVSALQAVLSIPGVMELVEKEIDLVTNSKKAVNLGPRNIFNGLDVESLKSVVSLERMRLEIERITK